MEKPIGTSSGSELIFEKFVGGVILRFFCQLGIDRRENSVLARISELTLKIQGIKGFCNIL
jgi:hypothetical protein